MLLKSPTSHSPRGSLSPRFSTAGFTLMEVVLALGIIAFAFIPMVGLLSVGLTTSRAAIDTTVEAQIAQKMRGLALQADYSNLVKLNEADLHHFDDQGSETSAPNAIYSAGFEVAATTPLPTDSTGGGSERLATVSISILNLSNRGPEGETDPSKNPQSSKYVLLIADNGR